ncbi:LIM domain only protein 7, partial [Dissostichus eleginoides]
AVTKKTLGSDDFRSALENGVLLCDLINNIKPGIIKRVNRLPTPIAGLDNLNVFLKACRKLGLKEAQLFHPGDLQDLSTRVTVKHQETNRRLKNVLITIFWLGRRAQCDRIYDGPYLNFKAFEGLLGTALYKSISSEITLKGSVEAPGFCSDTEVDSVFRMAENKDGLSYRRSVVITPKATAQFNQFLPSKDKAPAYVPAPLRKKRAERNEDHRRSWANPIYTEHEGALTSDCYGQSQVSQSALPAAHVPLAYEYESGSDSDAERPDPDLVLDDLASRRFHSPSPAPPTNFALPATPLAAGRAPAGSGGPWPKVNMTPNVAPPQNVTCLSSGVNSGEMQPPQQGSEREDHRRPVSTDSLFREIYGDSDDEDEEGYADPVQDDLYSRKMGIKPQPVAKVSYDKFLPKFWSPEEDLHIQKIKMGSQKRPWYKKIQGFSPHIQAHTLPQLPKIQSPLLETPPLVFAPVDPASGPRLVKCERWPLLGRQDPREPPDIFDYESIIPDLENDDMFTRRTLTFQSNTDMALMKTQLSAHRRLYTSEPQLNIITQRHGITEESEFPDIEQDDVVYRKEKSQQEQRPFSGAPDNYAPMSIPEPWNLPPELKARLLCPPCPLIQEVAADKQNEDANEDANEMRPKTDDMLVRKFGVCSDQSQSSLMMPSVPSFCSEGDLQRWKAIREASQLRHRKRLMVERLAALRQHQMQESIDGSKSTSDIQVEPSVNRQVRYEELQQVREKTKESDDKWQDDLSKWKNRRRSVNSDIVKKKEEREKTLKEMQEERGNKGRNSIGSRISSLSYLDDNEVFDKPVTSPRTRTFPARSYTIDTPYHSSEPSLKEVEPPAASPATSRAASPPTSREVDIVDRSAGSYATTSNTPTFTPRSRRSPSPAPLERSPVTERKNTVKTEETTTTFIPSLIPSITPSIRRSHSPTFAPLQRSPVTERKSRVKTEETTTTVISSSSSVQKVPEPRRPLSRIQTEVGAPSSGFLYKQQPQISSMEPKPPGVSHVSASLPRSYQKSDSARITSVVTARPFGTQSSRLSSLPRPFIAGQTDTVQKRVNGSADVSKKPSVPSRYQQFMTSEDEAQSQSSSVHSSEDEEEEEEKTTAKSMTSTKSVSPAPPQFKSETPVSPAPAKETSQENYSEMRISLNQKPNSSKDFGFQAVWDSTGARVTTIQPGGPAEMCPLQVGDEVLAVNGQQVAEMSYTAWKSCMEEALQEGNLVMDIRHHGKNNWDTDQPSLPYKSHKVINLTSMDHPTLLGSSDSNTVSSSLDFTSRTSMEKLATKEAPAYSVIDVASNRVNGGFREQPVTMRNKGGSGSSVSALVYLCGGPESAMPDILVPPIIPSSRWSWDPEEERKRQEKWQKEQERLLQEKYKRDQEKMQEEWMKAQQEVADSVEEEEEPESLVVDRHSLSPHSPLSPFNQPAFPSWEEEERKRKAEQERQRLEEETKSQSSPQLDEEEKPQRKAGGMAHWLLEEQTRNASQQAQSQRAASELEMERRNILNAMRYREPEKVTGGVVGDRMGKQSQSQAELERQQILNEMKKKTPMLRDKSWIRQNSAAIGTTQESDAPSMRRGESLDNLDTSYNSWRSSWTPRSTSHIPNYSAPYSGGPSLYGGGLGAQRPVSSTLPSSYSMGSLRGGAGPPSSPWSVSGKKICTFCDTPLGKGAAMIIESLGLCYHLTCFKCIDCKSELGGSEAGAEVRIRNKQLHCNSCYIRYKVGQPTSM